MSIPRILQCTKHNSDNLTIVAERFKITNVHDWHGYLALQPQRDIHKGCTAMLISTFHDRPTWFTIPCNETIQIDSFFLICAKPLPKNQTTSASLNNTKALDYFSPTKLASDGCPKHWFLLARKCLRVLMISNLKWNEGSINKCQKIKGNTLNITSGVNKVSLYDYFDTLLQHSSGDIIASLYVQGKCVHWYTKPGLLTHWSINRQEAICSDELKPSHILCEINLNISKTVAPSSKYHWNYFKCASGTYILNTYVCDNKVDCAQGEDENNMTCHTMCSEKKTGKVLSSDFCRDLCATSRCTCNPAMYFQCTEGGCIHYSLFCNFVVDCKNDTSDEENCAPKVEDKGDQFVCTNKQIINATLACDGIRHCFDGSDEFHALCENTLHAFICINNSQTIFARYQDDMRPDCFGTDLSDELLYEGMMNGSIAMDYTCKYPERDIPCKPGHPRCFPLTKLCVYERDVIGQMLSCRNGEHLFRCDFFPCPSPLIKCHLSYCIPVSYICDGHKDCPENDDETNCNSVEIKCPGMLRCKNSTCVHMQNVCDGIVDCHDTADDEQLCAYDNCQSGCTCVGPIYQCQINSDINFYNIPTDTAILILANQSLHINQTSFQDFHRLLILDIGYNGIGELSSGTFGPFAMQQYLLHLSLIHNRLSILRKNSFNGLKNLKSLLLEGNAISSVLDFAFDGLSSLPFLNLSSQKITLIETMAFVGLTSLTEINLSDNLLTELPNFVFASWHSISLVNIKNNTFRHLTKTIFHIDVKIHTFIVDLENYCCGLNVGKCDAPQTASTFCLGVLRTNFHKYRITFEVLCGLLINLILVYELIKRRNLVQSMSILRLNCAIADIMLVIYLAVLIIGDIYTTNFTHYFMTKSVWRTGVICKVAMFFSCSSILMSYMTFMLLSADLMLQTKYPLKTLKIRHQLSITYKWLLLFFWFIALSVAALVIAASNSMPNDICIFYFIPDKYHGPIELYFTVFIYIFITVSQTVICAMDYQSYVIIRTAGQTFKNSHAKKQSLRKLVITTTAQICLSAIKITAISLQSDKNVQLTIWTASLMCVNTLINPLLYAVNTC